MGLCIALKDIVLRNATLIYVRLDIGYYIPNLHLKILLVE